MTVQRPTGTLSTTGGLTAGTPATIATNLPASIAPQDARVAAQLEGLGAGGVVNTITHVVGIRYRADVRVSDEVLFGARTFEIVRVLNPEERNRELQLLCVEKVSKPMDAKFVSVYINQLGKTFRAGFGTPEDLAAGRLTPDLDGLAAFEDAQAAEYLRLNPPPPPEPEPEPEADDAPDYYVDPDPITVLSEIDLGTGSEG